MKKQLLIAIDGPSASGKGSLAKRIADHFKLPYLNTGALYRAVALRLINKNIPVHSFEEKIDELTNNIDHDDLENEQLFSEITGEVASIIAKNPALRKKLVNFQREFIKKGIENSGGAVLDGRDISSVIMPEANHKFFITATVAIRAERRYKQLKAKGDKVSYEEILAQLKKRDDNDKNRATSPLVIDKDAIIIDNGNLNIEETFSTALKSIHEKRN